MKFIGAGSLSSLVYKLLWLLNYLVPIGAFILIFILSVLCFAQPVDDPTVSIYSEFKYNLMTVTKEDKEAWEITRNSPVVVKAFMLSYVAFVSTLLFYIVRAAKPIFKNFANGAVFHQDNVSILSRLTKLVIVFSIFTFNFSSFLIGVILLILGDIFKGGAALQEEHDLTV